MARMNHSSKEHLVSMKPTKHGNKFRITYRCPNYPDLIHESFDTEEEANLRIAQILLEKKTTNCFRLLLLLIQMLIMHWHRKP